LVRQNKDIVNKGKIIGTIGKADEIDERNKVISALGSLYNIGIKINFESLKQDSNPWKISLPLYPFERKRHWIEYNEPITTGSVKTAVIEANDEIAVNVSTPVSVATEEKVSVSEDYTGRILQIWKSLTGREDIGLDEDFFELGGHSLLALQIITKIRSELGFKLSPKDFLANATINKLSAKLADESATVARKDS
jgi:acyl carrier protein